jgi:hypothetical protein
MLNDSVGNQNGRAFTKNDRTECYNGLAFMLNDSVGNQNGRAFMLYD